MSENSRAKNVLVIGGTSGIGRALCLEYLARGFKIAVSGRRKELLDSLKEAAPSDIYIYKNDVTTLSAAQLIAAASAEMGGLGIIIICAGYGDINLDLDAETELKTANTNVCGFTDCAVAAYRYFKKNGGGKLAATSSIASFRGGWAAPSYYASKAYVSSYMEGLRIKAYKEEAGIDMCTVIPGFVDTALAKGVGGEGLFWVAPADKAARQIADAIAKNRKTVYITKRWRLIAWAMKLLPEFIYRQL